MRYLLIILLALSNLLSAQVTEYPEAYQALIYAAQERYDILRSIPGNDIVIDPIETIPLIESYSGQYSNYAKDIYDLDMTKVPSRKGVSFVVDTEGWLFHEDLQEAAWNELAKSFTGEESLGNINGHGIHCAGIMASKEEGLLYEYVKQGYFKVVVLKGLKDSGTGSLSDVIAAIEYVISITDWLQSQNYVVGISLSLGASGSIPAMDEVIARAKAKGILVTASSGNTGKQPVGTPANAEDAFAIGSIYKDFKKSWFSTEGSDLWSVSFGQEIRSTDINNTYTTKNGTSMSCPNQHARSMYDLMNEDITVDEAMDPGRFTDLGSPGFDVKYGYGMNTIEGTEPNPPSPPMDSVATFKVPIKERYELVWGESFSEKNKFYITEIMLDVRTQRPSAEGIGEVVEAVRDFHTNKGYIVRPGDDFDEAVGINWHFLNMFMNGDQWYGLDISIDYMDGMTEEGYPIRIYKSALKGNILSQEHGIIIYDYR